MDSYLLKAQKRNIKIDERCTSLQLERYIWANLEGVLDLTGLDLEQVLTAINQRRHNASLAQTVRLFCTIYYHVYLDKLTGGLGKLSQKSTTKGDVLAASEAEPFDALDCYHTALDNLDEASRK